ncbi:MAG: glycoside hydrolase family 2 TIM barrel-domain containing protein [Victivallales bacterium]
MFTFQRKSVDLNGAWKFCPDPMQRCRRQKWWKNVPKGNELFPCWNENGLWDIQVPGTWKTQFEELRWYDGHAVYMKNFKVNEDLSGQEAFLCFDGVVYEAEVYLNGHLVGKHEWGYSPFQYRVTDYLREDNQLFVLVDNHLRADRVPGEIFDWNNDGGIINPVKLVIVPAVHISNYRVSTRLTDNSAELEFEVELGSRNEAACEEITLEIPELCIREKISAGVGAASKITSSVPRSKIKLWSPETPKLYQIKFSTRFEAITDETGFREIKTRGQDILLNGEKIRLYGVCVHSDFPGTGRTAATTGINLMIEKAKELGLNFLRCAHYPYNEEFGRAMDRAGLMWWEEVPAYWLSTMHHDGMTRKAMGMMEETVRRDWNRASLIVWSVSNECCYRNPDNYAENNYPYWFKSVAMLRKLDPSRPISCAEAGNHVSLNSKWSPANNDQFSTDYKEKWIPAHSDDWHGLCDILSANIYVGNAGEAENAYRNFVEMLKAFDKPLVLSEFGSMSLRGSDVPPDKLGSEERHSAIIREAYDIFGKLPEISGYCPWCLADMRGPLHWRWYNSGKAVCRYGFLDENWVPKKVFSTLKDCISKLKRSLQNIR